MNAGEIAGLVGGIVGCIGGFAGGMFGTYCSIKNTNGPREKSFMVKASIVCWAAILFFLAVLFTLPTPCRWLVWIPYPLLMFIGIKYLNGNQQRIRQEESQNQQSEYSSLARRNSQGECSQRKMM